MRVFLHYEECWDLKQQLNNALDNNGPRYDLVGWQAKRFYLSYGGEFEYIEWEIDPFPSEVCPACHLRVAAGDVETGTYYSEEDSYVCRLRLSMCSYCRGEHSVDGGWDWPRGKDGRWLPSQDCEAVA